jgi:hypothetical protein
MEAMSIVTEQSRFGPENYSFPSLKLNEMQNRELQVCGDYPVVSLEAPIVRLADLRKLSEISLNDSMSINVFLAKKSNNETNRICCVIKGYDSIRKSAESRFMRKESISIYMNAEQMFNVLDIFNMPRSKFMSLPQSYNVIIRDEEKSQLILKIIDNVDHEVSLKTLDLRVYYKNPDVEHLTSTKYGVSFCGYSQMKAFSDLRVEIDSAVTRLRDFLTICSYVTLDISNRFVVYNSYCSEEVQQKFISIASNFPQLLVKISEFIFDPTGLINYYSQNFLQYQSLMLDCHSRFNVEDVLEFNTLAIARELFKLYANGPIVIPTKDVATTPAALTDGGMKALIDFEFDGLKEDDLDSTVEFVGDLDDDPDPEIVAFLERIESVDRIEKKSKKVLPTIHERTPTNKRKLPVLEKCKPKSKKKSIAPPNLLVNENSQF